MTLFCTISGCVFLLALSALVLSFVVSSGVEAAESYRRSRMDYAPAARIRREVTDIQMWCSHDHKIVQVCDRILAVLNAQLEDELDDIMPLDQWRDSVCPVQSPSKLQDACGNVGVGDRRLI